MESVEFYMFNGFTCIYKNGTGKTMALDDREEIEFMIGKIRDIFPEAYEALEKWAADAKPNRLYFEFKIVDRFIRCNFGETDFLKPDIEMGLLNLEEVKCPLRRICKHENIICKPRPHLPLSEEETEVAKLYAKGLLPKEIAQKLGKAESTCKKQITKACKKLHLPHPRGLIGLFSLYNITGF